MPEIRLVWRSLWWVVFVRDLMLERPIEDVDVVVEGDGIAFARYFASMHHCRFHQHRKFNTAVIIFEDGF